MIGNTNAEGKWYEVGRKVFFRGDISIIRLVFDFQPSHCQILQPEGFYFEAYWPVKHELDQPSSDMARNLEVLKYLLEKQPPSTEDLKVLIDRLLVPRREYHREGPLKGIERTFKLSSAFKLSRFTLYRRQRATVDSNA
jgi:hypothetical protein